MRNSPPEQLLRLANILPTHSQDLWCYPFGRAVLDLVNPELNYLVYSYTPEQATEHEFFWRLDMQRQRSERRGWRVVVMHPGEEEAAAQAIMELRAAAEKKELPRYNRLGKEIKPRRQGKKAVPRVHKWSRGIGR